MTVWTNVSVDDANKWLVKNYGLTAHGISPISEGVEDSVFRVLLDNHSSVFLRLFERTEPIGPLSVAANLAAAGLPTCPPIADKNGRLVSLLNSKPASLFPWVDGAWVSEPSLEQIASIGTFMGRMAGEGAKHCQNWVRENPRGWTWFVETTQKLLPVLPSSTSTEIEHELNVQKSYWGSLDKSKVQHGPIHADMFRNNVMFDNKGKLAAVIDWGFCASDSPMIYDLAIVANDWCLQNGSHTLDKQKTNALINARNKVCPFTAEEERAWPMALRLAALRFYLSRQHDASFPRDEGGKTLDPTHFYKILCEHKYSGVTENSHRPCSDANVRPLIAVAAFMPR